ncbi:N-methyl-L-tryptophan oxidase [candidate division KSB1 bacterium]|nr:N-methyl-L-tryptophan oxidase [candidate division KSB1 bacterium]
MTRPNSFDVIIAGLGAMGSAAAYHLARRSQRVLGLDRFAPPHAFGSSHGQTRIIREAYFEHPLYVPLVQRAYENWAELERESGQRLFQQTGGLMIGPLDGQLVAGAQRSAQIHHLPHELLTAAEMRQRFPAFRPSDDMVAVWEPRAGILFPERCIEAHLQMARQCGAVLHFDEPATAWERDGDGVRVLTSNGEYRAQRLLITAGAWTGRFIAELALPLTIERQVLLWFDPIAHSEHFDSQRCPIYIAEHEPNRFIYGFPNLGEGVKVGRHHEGESADPDGVRREAGPEDIEAMRAILCRFMPAIDTAPRVSAVCLYTNTPDSHFLIDFHPHHPHVLLASICSGHGFKFSSAFGEILADLLIEGRSTFDLSLFRLERFKRSW